MPFPVSTAAAYVNTSAEICPAYQTAASLVEPNFVLLPTQVDETRRECEQIVAEIKARWNQNKRDCYEIGKLKDCKWLNDRQTQRFANRAAAYCEGMNTDNRFMASAFFCIFVPIATIAGLFSACFCDRSIKRIT